MYGLKDLKPVITITASYIECPVRGCDHRVQRRHKSDHAEARFQCPEHRIYISPTTFEYPDEKDNLLWKEEADLALLEAIKVVKREIRMEHDNSEDAVTWNVFRYLENANLLRGFLSWFTGREQGRTDLIYWSYSQNDKGAFPGLDKARKEFGEHLQRSSEPDLIAVTDQALFFLESKLTSNNETLPSDPKNHKKYLTGDAWFKGVFASDFDTVVVQAKKYELFRFWLLGSWMAAQIKRDFYLVNIVPSAREINIEARIIPYLQPDKSRHFMRLAWEDIYHWGSRHAPEGETKNKWMSFFENKSMGYDQSQNLQRAFSMPMNT